MPKIDAAEHLRPEQWLGCVRCKVVHHITSFCDCGRCFFRSDISRPGEGTSMDFDVVRCACGKTLIWD